jgi:hypothetical protein
MKHQARCLIALEGDTDTNRFVVGSLELRGENGTQYFQSKLLSSQVSAFCSQRLPMVLWLQQPVTVCPRHHRWKEPRLAVRDGTHITPTLSELAAAVHSPASIHAQ